MRPGAEYFTRPAGAGQRRYEALRAYFVEDGTAAEIADRYGYSTASVHQMATLVRTGKLAAFVEAKPGPKGPRKATGAVREKALALRADGRSVGEIAAALAESGTPISAQTVWQILDAAGLPRLDRRDDTRRGSPAKLEPVKAAAQPHWPAGATIDCPHAGLLLLFPAIVELGLHRLVGQAGYPSTSAISAWQSVGTLLLAKCARRHRAHHIDALTDDAGLAHALQLTALPKATHAGSYSYRVRRDCNHKLFTGLVKNLRELGMASGEQGFNLDFHAIRHHGEDTVLEKHYVPRRSQRTRAVLTFFAQDHASTEMVYANAEITKAEQAREILAFADYWHAATGEDPGLLVFDSQLTTYT
ncbi:MAG: helix-turn-helix domain-containing protein, partial [Pseudonocardiaceae bacterium]